jgi:hypothetical protein
VDIAYWLLAWLLAAFYAYAGGRKLAQSQPELAPMMAWAGTTIPMPGVRAIGAVELLGAIGLVLPPLLDIVATSLAIAAAIGLAVLQVLAALFHLWRRETKDVWLNIVLFLLAAATAWLAAAR